MKGIDFTAAEQWSEASSFQSLLCTVHVARGNVSLCPSGTKLP